MTSYGTIVVGVVRVTVGRLEALYNPEHFDYMTDCGVCGTLSDCVESVRYFLHFGTIREEM